MRDDGGTITLWVLGFCIALLFLGGLSIDLWRAFTERRLLAGIADGAVVAAATAVDLEEWRTTGAVQLDPDEAGLRAAGYLTSHPEWDPGITESINSVPEEITVSLQREVDFTLLRILLADEAPFTVTVTARSTPTLNP